MTFAKLSFSTPIYYETRPSCLSLNSLRESVDGYCDWGNETAYVLTGFTNCVKLRKNSTPQNYAHWIKCALKVASYFTLIVPVLMYLAKYLLRSSPFYIVSPVQSKVDYDQTQNAIKTDLPGPTITQPTPLAHSQKAVNNLPLQNAAATQVQKICRGYLSRKVYQQQLKSTAVPVQGVIEKTTLLQNAVTWLGVEHNQKQIQTQLKIKNIETALYEANSFLQKSLGKLRNGENSPVPLYYHATSSTSCINIIRSQEIRVTNAACGVGAWVSTNNEWQQFGRYTLALDEMSVKTLPARYFPVKGYGAIVHFSLFIGVKKPIKINTQNVAAIIVRDRQEIDEMRISINNAGFSKCEILSGEAGDIVQYALDSVLHRRERPSEWIPETVSEKHYCHPFPEMPRNAVGWKWTFRSKTTGESAGKG